MKLILAIFLCLSFLLSASAQTEDTESNDNDETNVTNITLARKDSDGNIVEDVEVFYPTDIPIYCYVDLSLAKPVLVRVNFIAVKVKGVRPNSKTLSVSYKTKNGENFVTFTGKPEKIWSVGSYRVDILINKKLVKSKEFVVERKPRSD